MAVGGFAPGVVERLGYYVYLLIDPRDGKVFYVGKGTGNRCFAHLAEARKTQADTVGEYAKLRHIRNIEATKEPVRIDILRHGLTEDEAYRVESTAIDALGFERLDNRDLGHHATRMSIDQINGQYGSSPVIIDPIRRVVLIRINRQFSYGMTACELYEVTRQWWKIGPRRRDSGSGWAPQWAMAVYASVVRAVYRIEGWSPDPKGSGRWAFEGTRDPDMEAFYLYGDVTGYLRGANARYASQSPLRFVNCGPGKATDGSDSSA